MTDEQKKHIEELEHEFFLVQHALIAYVTKQQHPKMEFDYPIIWPVKLDKLQQAIDNVN